MLLKIYGRSSKSLNGVRLCSSTSTCPSLGASIMLARQIILMKSNLGKNMKNGSNRRHPL